MYGVHEMELPEGRLGDFVALLPTARAEQFLAACRNWSGSRDATIWHVNSTGDGGGVAELIRAVGGYAVAAGVRVRWLVVDAAADFFVLTKRIDNGVSGIAGDGGPLGPAEQDAFAEASRRIGQQLAARIRPGDYVVLHDPQTAGLVPYASAAGATVVWRAHNGSDVENRHTRRAWSFLLPHLRAADLVVTTLERFAPEALRAAGPRLATQPPCIDPLTTKNAPLGHRDADAVLGAAGLAAPTGATGDPLGVDVLGCGPWADADPLVVQVARWDAVKDMDGTMLAFARHVAPRSDARLLLAGPEVTGVADDPEAAAVFRRCAETWRALPGDVRQRIRLACLPMDDLTANARLVAALYTRADVVTQKSLSEGFGLTATEAMWRGRALVVGDVGGLRHQVRDGAGLAVDPHDGRRFGEHVLALLRDPAARRDLGRRAQRRVREEFLPDRHLERELGLLRDVPARSAA